ncbi:MAG: SGNH/GDSL hydrolase family protein [Phycisphaerales bacterium]|nr:SGNH/GDSL hydrolase family protein [Phycisphaerales bacterium]
MVQVIGDSHTSVFAGSYRLAPIYPRRANLALPGVQVWHLGAHLAHSVGTPRHHVRRKIKAITSKSKRGDCMLLYFGEIDCRFHVVKHAGSQRRIGTVARDVAQRYVEAAHTLVGKRPLGFICAPPPTVTPINNDLHPINGTFVQRLVAVRAFNSALHKAARHVGAQVLDVFDALGDAEHRPRACYFDDGVHADPRALLLFVRELANWGWLAPKASEAVAAAQAIAHVQPPERLPPLVLPGGLEQPGAACELLVRYAAARCAAQGAARIGLYGAGAHTRRIRFDPFEAAGLRVVCVIDDRATARSILGVPIRRLAEVRDIDAVIVSSDAHEAKLLAKARSTLGRRGIKVYPIYDWKAV